MPTVEQIIETQPRYKSPPGYESWLSHIKFCAQAILLIQKNLNNYEPQSVEHKTGVISHGVYMHALRTFAPPYYLSKELIEALHETSSVLPPNAPIALPTVHLMLPSNTISKSPASITACCSRNIDNDYLQPNHKAPADALLLGISVIVNRSVIGFTVYITPDFESYAMTPNIEDIKFDDDESLEWYDAIRITAARIVVHALLIMQYQPEFVTVESSCHGRGAGFGSAANKAAANYFPTRWLGKYYKRKLFKSQLNGSHASPRAHWRKGHWHNFRCGPGRKQLKLKWIEPVFVNP